METPADRHPHAWHMKAHKRLHSNA